MNHFRILQSNHQKNSIKLRSDRQRINDQLLYILIIQLFLAPFFFGSNRPAFWFLWSCTISGTTAWWLLMMGINGSRLGVALTHIRSLAALFILLACYMIAQILPLGLLVPQLPASDNTQAILPINTISLAPGDTLLALIRWLSYGLLFFLVLQLSANASRAAKLNGLLFWCIAIHAFLGLALLYQFNDTIYGIPKWDHHGSATGGFTNRNSFATLLAFGCILGTVQIIQSLKQLFRTSTQKKSLAQDYQTTVRIIPVLIGWLIIVSALIATNSRMGIFAAGCGMLCCMLLDASRLPTKSRRKAIALYTSSALLFAAPVIYLYGAQYIERLGQLETGDINYRLTLYSQIKTMIEARPLTGFGGDSFEYSFPWFHQPNMDIDRVSQKAHSTYLALWSDYGIIFGSIPLIIVGYLLFRIVREYLKRDYSEPILLAAIGTIITGILHSLVDFSLEVEAVTFIFVTITAAGLSQTFVKKLK